MSEASSKMVSHSKQDDRGPDYFGYYKHSALDLFSQNEDIRLAISELESVPSAGAYSGVEVNKFSGSDSLFNDQLVEGLSNFKRERLKMLLKQSIVGLTREIDEIHSRILAMFQIEENLEVKELVFSSEDLEEPESSMSQKLSMLDKLSKLADTCKYHTFRKAYKDFQVLLHDTGLEAEDAVDKCFDDTLSELDQMEQNLEEYLNILASKCRNCLASGCISSLSRHLTELLRSLIVGNRPRSSSLTRFILILKTRIMPHYGDCISTSKLLQGPTMLRTSQMGRHEYIVFLPLISMCSRSYVKDGC